MTRTVHHQWDANAARYAGALYLAIAVCGGFSIGYVPMQIVGPDGVTSIANLAANEGLFLLGVFADCAVILFELAITAVLYQLFRSISPLISTIALISRAGMIVVMGLNLLIWVLPYALMQSASGPHVSPEMVQLSFRAHDLGVFVWQLFFGVHLLALGWLTLRSSIVPTILGRGLFIGAFGYLIQGVAELMFIDLPIINALVILLLIIVTVSEISFGLWLLIRGARKPSTTALSFA
ncbi:MAG: DUF4386 domain-containing protein [Yoonia sp.]|uniref:DUF4386 domain-containing protein n=1 Tax=Yoonia sp. TaxID=2212373 RepID=UPI003263C10F